MGLMVYCISETHEHDGPLPIQGVYGRPVFSLANDGVAAAVSEIRPSDLSHDISQVMAFGKVVEFFHRTQTVIPMRFGCVFEGECEVVRVLGERSEKYKALLRRLEGCVEMGIRVFAKSAEGDLPNGEPPLPRAAPNLADALSPGRAHLESRRAHYAEEERSAAEASVLIERCRAAFRGLFVQFRTEAETFGAFRLAFRASLVSLHFLVRRECVEPFRRAFHHLGKEVSVRLLLSGPWPPYNFVDSDTSGAATVSGTQDYSPIPA